MFSFMCYDETHLPALYFSSRSQMDLLEYGSTPEVGSSKITTFDPPTNAMATDSFLCIPPVGCVRNTPWRDRIHFKHTLKAEERVVHLRGSEPLRLSCEATRGQPACPQPPSPPPLESDLWAMSKTGCAPPRWDWNTQIKILLESECFEFVL